MCNAKKKKKDIKKKNNNNQCGRKKDRILKRWENGEMKKKRTTEFLKLMKEKI